MARNYLIVEKPLVDSDLDFPGINDSRELHDNFHSGSRRAAIFKQGEVSMRRPRN